MNRYFALLCSVLFGGCANGASLPSGTPLSNGPVERQSIASHFVSPELCNENHRSVVKRHTTVWKIPNCAGWSGQITYAAFQHLFKPSTCRFLTQSSVTNNFGVPPPPTGTAVFYATVEQDCRDNFGAFGNAAPPSTITGPGITYPHTYTIYLYDFLEDTACSGDPCAFNIGSPQQGSNTINYPSVTPGLVFGGDPVIWQFVQN